MMRGSNIHYQLSSRIAGSSYGGMGTMHTLVKNLGLVQEMDRHFELLKLRLPYPESDHVLNVAYNILSGGERLEDIELRRQEESFLDGLGAQRIPNPTTAGDFTRRFQVADIATLQECINRTRQRLWQQQPEGFLREAFIDVEGMLAPTYGQCKGEMGLSYKGVWGYAPLIVSLANRRCDQENVIEQLKNGVNAMRMPGNDLVSNWAYMVMAALAWNPKAWYGLLVPDRERGLELMRMEFRRFLRAILLLPVQIIRGGCRIVYRLLGDNGWLKDFFVTRQRLQKLERVE